MALDFLKTALQQLKAYKNEIKPKVLTIVNDLLQHNRLGKYINKMLEDLGKYRKPFSTIAYILLGLVAASAAIAEIIWFAPYFVITALLVKIVMPYINRFLEGTYDYFSGNRYANVSSEGWSDIVLLLGRIPYVAMAMYEALTSRPQSLSDYLMKPILLIMTPILVIISLVQEIANFATTLRGAIIILTAPVAIAVSISYFVLMIPSYLKAVLGPCLGLKKPVERYNPNAEEDVAGVPVAPSVGPEAGSSAAQALLNAAPAANDAVVGLLPADEAPIAPTLHFPPVLAAVPPVNAQNGALADEVEPVGVNPYECNNKAPFSFQ